jgi:hypothetical protein
MTLLAALCAADPPAGVRAPIVAAIPLAARDRLEYEPLVGRFARTAAIAVGAGDASFDALLARVRDAVSRAPAARADAGPVPGIRLDVVPPQTVLPWLPGLTVRTEERTPPPPDAAVAVTVTHEPDGALRIASASNDARFDREALESLHARLYAVIETAASETLSRKADAVARTF